PWADIDIALLVEREVFPAQRTILTPRHVFNWNVWRDLLLVDDPIERFGRTISRVGGKVVRLEIEALFGPLDHRLCGADLSLTHGSRRFDINDDAELDINEIIIGISKECWPAHRTGPLRGPIARRDELRCHIARRTKCGIIKGRQILSRGAARGLGDAFDAGYRSLLFGVSDNE